MFGYRIHWYGMTAGAWQHRCNNRTEFLQSRFSNVATAQQ
ncbi:hypothetical protein HMPREF3034_00463 [Prevotella sp. DNF00663]|nr:hypothetical protein HMPREF3034_00463 [Prevotella sp. DNF00663]